MTPQTSNIQFSETELDKLFATLTSVDKDLKSHFDKYLWEEYKGDLCERLSYLDIAEISRFLVDNKKSGQTYFFQNFFNQVEFILSNCDSAIDN